MRTTSISSEFDAPADVVWSGVKTPQAFVHVADGLLRFPAAERLVGPWRVGQILTGWTFLFDVVPFSKHHLTIAAIDDEARVLVSDEHGGPLRRWHHTLHVEPLADGRCRYTDTIEIDAGPLTTLVVAYAEVFYRYRQRRWQRLARLLAAVDATRVGSTVVDDHAASPEPGPVPQ